MPPPEDFWAWLAGFESRNMGSCWKLWAEQDSSPLQHRDHTGCRIFQVGWGFRKFTIQPFVQSKPNTGFRAGFSGICIEPSRVGIPPFPLAPIPLLICSRGEFYSLVSHQILLEQPRLRHQFPQPFSQPWFCKTSLEAERRSHPCPRD